VAVLEPGALVLQAGPAVVAAVVVAARSSRELQHLAKVRRFQSLSEPAAERRYLQLAGGQEWTESPGEFHRPLEPRVTVAMEDLPEPSFVLTKAMEAELTPMASLAVVEHPDQGSLVVMTGY
jgi:hypothetical protein